MFFNFNLNEILTFPFKDEEARKHLLIGALVSISAFIIPILPFFVLTGYAVQVARQVLRGESPRMVAWDDWNSLFKDGAKIFGVRIIYTLPIIVLLLPVMVISFILPFVSTNSSTPEADPFFFIFMGVFGLTMCLLFPISIAIALIVPAAEMHAAEKDEFAAGFRIREWWAIFRANLSGFLAAFGIYMLASFAIGIITQILMVTVVLACLLPILLPASTIYSLLIMYVTVAQAYREGKAKLEQGGAITAS